MAIINTNKSKFPKKADKELNELSKQELKELVMINSYKLALMRSQLEAISNILIKKKIATYEEIWKKTNENFEETVRS